MSDLETYLAHCYDLLLNKEERQPAQNEEECVCASLIEHQDKTTQTPNQGD